MSGAAVRHSQSSCGSDTRLAGELGSIRLQTPSPISPFLPLADPPSEDCFPTQGLAARARQICRPIVRSGSGVI